MKDIYGIIKKELDKIFKFPRMIFSTLLLPGLLIFFIYVIMGQSFNIQESVTETHESIIYVINMPTSYQDIIGNVENIQLYNGDESRIDELKDKLFKSEIDVIVAFENDFDSKVENKGKPNIDIYYNPSSSPSSAAYGIIQNTLNIHKDQLLVKLGIDANIITYSDNKVYDENKLAGSVLAMLLPMFIMIAIFAGGLSVGTDAIAGEKERGTLATLLMTPIKKNSIIIGKIISTAIITILNALSSFVGIIASLPFAKSMFAVEGTVNYSFGDYAMLFGILIVLALLSSSLMLLVSTIAKSTKEASMYGMPIYIIAILTTTLSMFSEAKDSSATMYLIPIYNCTLALKSIFSFQAQPLYILLTIGSTIIYISITIVLLLRMFKSERVLFTK